MSGIRKGYVSSAHGQIHFRRLLAGPGGGKTPLVFLHQTASSSAMWEKVMLCMNGAYDMVALDTPGFGGSYDPDEVPSVACYTDALLEGIDVLGFERFHVCGHHTGACIAVEMAAQHPGRVASLAMIGPVQLTAEERDEFRKHFSEPFAPTADGAYLEQTWNYLGQLGADRALELHHREVVDTLRAWRGRAQAYAAVWDQDFPALFESVRCPVLLMAAKDDVLWPYFERAGEARPGAETSIIEGANFEPDLDPDGVAGALRRFLEKQIEVA